MPSLLLGWPNKREGEQKILHTFSDNTRSSRRTRVPEESSPACRGEHKRVRDPEHKRVRDPLISNVYFLMFTLRKWGSKGEYDTF